MTVITTHMTLREFRRHREFSLRDLERETGVNRATLSMIETGKLIPEQRHLAAISRALAVAPERIRVRLVVEVAP